MVLATETARLQSHVDDGVVEAASAARDDPGLSIVEAALAAAGLGATAMHDPTEGGLAGGLNELAFASEVSVRVNRAQVAWFEPGVALCEAAGLDPWATLASGSLLATFEPAALRPAVAELLASGHVVKVIAEVQDGSGVIDTEGSTVPMPDRDEIARLLERQS